MSCTQRRIARLGKHGASGSGDSGDSGTGADVSAQGLVDLDQVLADAERRLQSQASESITEMEALRSRVAAAEACLVQAQVHPYTALCTTLQHCLWRGRLAAQMSVSL